VTPAGKVNAETGVFAGTMPEAACGEFVFRRD
jgi:hypothetical protein